MIPRTLKFICTIFSIIWVIILFSEYWRYNPSYSKSIELFQYADLLILYLGIGGLAIWYLKRPRQTPIKTLNGLSIFLALLVLDILAVNRFTIKEPGISFTIKGLFSHLGQFVGVAFCVFLIYLLIRVIGRIITNIFTFKITKTDLPIIEAAIGIMSLTLFLFLLGAIGLLNVFFIIPLPVLILTIFWRQSRDVIKSTLLARIEIPKELNYIGILSFLFLGIFLSWNFAQILRPFPIGSDSLREYVNLPNLLAQNGTLIDGHQPYNWSLFMSLGKSIFGRIDVVLALSYFGGILSLFALFQLSKKWIDVNYSALVLLLFYSTPMVNFLSYMDMKVDMALLFFTLTPLLVFYNWMAPEKVVLHKASENGFTKVKSLFKERTPSFIQDNNLFVLIGLLLGFGFGIKLTALFFILSLFCALWYFKGNTITFVAACSTCLAAVFLLKLDATPNLRQFHSHVGVLQWTLLGIGLTAMAHQFIKQKETLLQLLKHSAILSMFIALPIIPWMGKNMIETGKVSVTSLLNGKMASPIFEMEKVKKTTSDEKIIIPGYYRMPETSEPVLTQEEIEKKARKKTKGKKKTGVSEDLHRFMGYESIPIRYLSIPYDIIIKTNLPDFFIDIGFVLLLLFPFLFLIMGQNATTWKTAASQLTFMLLSTVLLIISIPSAFLNQNNLIHVPEGIALLKSETPSGIFQKISHNTNSILLEIYHPFNEWVLSNVSMKNGITYPILILLFMIISGITFVRMQNHKREIKTIVSFLLVYSLLWWILGSGATWYGILLFCIPFIFLFKSIAPDSYSTSKKENKSLSFSKLPLKKVLFLSVVCAWVFLAFTNRSANYTPYTKEQANRLFYPPIMKYTMGELDIKKLKTYHFPGVSNVVDLLNKDKNALIYMIGTPCSFFIDKNDKRVLSDTFLDFFDTLLRRYKSKDQIIAKLKEEGFKYILFDLKMANYDKTNDKTLTKKFIQFLNTLYSNSQVKFLETDRKIKLNNSGEVVNAVFPDRGEIVSFGNLALFEIK